MKIMPCAAVVLLCMGVFSTTLIAKEAPAICGQWESAASPSSNNEADDTQWVLTFREDGALSFFKLRREDRQPGDRLQAVFTCTKTNIHLRGPGMKDVILPYMLNGTVLHIDFSDASMPKDYHRVYTVSELSEKLTMQEGMYRFHLTLPVISDKSKLSGLFGSNVAEYESIMGEPIELETFPLQAVGSDYFFPLSGAQFGTPSFDGKTFRMDGAISEKVFGTFDGRRINDKKIAGNFTTKDTIINGTFSIDRIGPLNMNDGVDISMPDGSHFKTGNAFDASEDAKPVSEKKASVDLATPERTAAEIIKASQERDINRMWACASTEFKRDIMNQIGGTEAEAKSQLRNWMFDADAPKLQSGEIVGKHMVDETHCAVHVKWVVVGAGPQTGGPIQLVKEKEEWRLLKLH